MPYYPEGKKKTGGHEYRNEMAGEFLVIKSTGMNLPQVQELDLDVYLYIQRNAYIAEMNKTEEGRKYLDNCWRITQTKPDRKALRERYNKERGAKQ